MKFIFSITILLLFTQTIFSQTQDSTLEKLFENYDSEQIRQFMQASLGKDFNPITVAYLSDLSFKIPTLNPISNQKINSQYGYRIHPITGEMKKHHGIDIFGINGQPVYAAADGEIIEVGFNNFLGNYVKIKHLLGYESVYGHLQASLVQPKNDVYQGQIIGYCGSTGRTTGVHLHFAIRWKNEFLNPYPYIF